MCATSAGASGELYAWKRKYAGMEASDAKRLKQLEDENRQLKRLWDQALNL
jgi:putative transposase